MKRERLRLGVNQATVSFLTAIAISDISKIETGRLRPYPNQLERLASFFDVDGATLLEDVPDTAALEREADARPASQDGLTPAEAV
jgi:transcriptional regulator with XRE-family HTH domain